MTETKPLSRAGSKLRKVPPPPPPPGPQEMEERISGGTTATAPGPSVSTMPLPTASSAPTSIPPNLPATTTTSTAPPPVPAKPPRPPSLRARTTPTSPSHPSPPTSPRAHRSPPQTPREPGQISSSNPTFDPISLYGPGPTSTAFLPNSPGSPPPTGARRSSETARTLVNPAPLHSRTKSSSTSMSRMAPTGGGSGGTEILGAVMAAGVVTGLERERERNGETDTMSMTPTFTPPPVPSPYPLSQRQPSITRYASSSSPLNPNAIPHSHPNSAGPSRRPTVNSGGNGGGLRGPMIAPVAGSSSQPVSPATPTTPVSSGLNAEKPLLSSGPRNMVPNNGSMILWRMSNPKSPEPTDGLAYTDDSKYPISSSRSQPNTISRSVPNSTLIPYAYNPFLDLDADPNADPFADEKNLRYTGFNWRGILTLGGLITLIAGILTLFVFYPIFSFINGEPKRLLITGNVQINGTGQAPDLPNMPLLIDPDTPATAKTRVGFDNKEYELVFSDEFETPGRTFFPGDDPFWEAVDLWYWATTDLEWYDPKQVTTRDGALIITMESVLNHNLNFRSGMLQSWNKFCFTGGYIEVALSLPGQDNEVMGYWPGAWIMGNLGRPGFGASTDGMWPYSYDTCDLGTFPNQTNQDRNAPPAALHTDQGREKYNFELSWLPGQRLSACTCPREDHPGPVKDGKFVGRGVPEIDILEAQKNKLGDGAKVSQSVQMAPFDADYQANWDALTIMDTSVTARNSYNGSAVQQAISCLTTIPPRVFNGTGGEYAMFGFEYWSDPDNRDDGFITWQADSQKTFTATAATMQGGTASQVGRRLVSEEPMAIVLNLGISQSFQNVVPDTLTFPAEFRIDYVRVYQRKGETNIGCDGKNRPTTKYIQDHLVAYSNPNVTTWPAANFTKPKNGLFSNGC